MSVKTERVVYWIGEPPTHCDLTNASITDTFVDGRMPGSTTWGCFLPSAFEQVGGTYGTGNGQRYVKQPIGAEDAGRWLKVEG